MTADDQLVPDQHPHLGAFRAGEHVFATGFLVGLLEAPCLTSLRRRARAGQAPVGTKVEVAHRAPSIPGDRLHVTARRTSTTGNRSGFAVTAVDQHGVLVADGHVTAQLVSPPSWSTRPRSVPGSATAPRPGGLSPLTSRFTAPQEDQQ